MGLEKLIAKQAHYDRLDRAEKELTAKERYLKAKARLEELETEKAGLEQIISGYKPIPTA